MRVRYDPDFLDKLKRVNVRIRKSFNEQIELFKQNPHNSQLHNHALKEPYEGLRSIDITNDYCAVYEGKRSRGKLFENQRLNFLAFAHIFY
jgi:addiction module RelE/StbE family toxin